MRGEGETERRQWTKPNPRKGRNPQKKEKKIKKKNGEKTDWQGCGREEEVGTGGGGANPYYKQKKSHCERSKGIMG